MLQFEGEWRFDSPGAIAPGVARAFEEFIAKIGGGSLNRWSIFETFKGHFAQAAAMPHNSSSSESWAQTDLDRIMGFATENAPLFIEAFYDACESLRTTGAEVPSLDRINRALSDNKAGYRIEPPNLVATTDFAPVAVATLSPSLEADAKQIIQISLESVDELLQKGDARRAVQEALWVLETVTTTIISESDIAGKYFNEIVKELRAGGRGTPQEQILKWMMTLHGWLSSPTGGGVRHGADLKTGVAMELNEARLYCNLIRSYMLFIIEEHDRRKPRQ